MENMVFSFLKKRGLGLRKHGFKKGAGARKHGFLMLSGKHGKHGKHGFLERPLYN